MNDCKNCDRLSDKYCDLADTCVRVMKDLGHLEGYEPSSLHPDQVENCLRRVTAERDRYKAALEEIDRLTFVDGSNCWDIVKKALHPSEIKQQTKECQHNYVYDSTLGHSFCSLCNQWKAPVDNSGIRRSGE